MDGEADWWITSGNIGLRPLARVMGVGRQQQHGAGRGQQQQELRMIVGVEPITTVIRSGRLRWYGHVMRKGDEDWVKKCMEFRVEGRRPVGRPRRT